MHVHEPSPLEYWQSAIQLFQPALIRLLDQLRGQLAEAGWQAQYETREIWADVPPSEESAPQILYLIFLQKQPQSTLENQPELSLEKIQVNLWELCYQICFQDYQPQLAREFIADFQPGQVTPDQTLLDADGEVDWHSLDQKAHAVVQQLIQTLNSVNLRA